MTKEHRPHITFHIAEGVYTFDIDGGPEIEITSDYLNLFMDILKNQGEFGKKQERDRIIALLDAWVADDYGDFDKTLALIKGENE